MPKQSSKKPQRQPSSFAKKVVDVPVEDEMSESFMAYSLSVITSRAIPDARDGLKPVQRRILYSMLNMGIRPERPHRKSARVVGDTMGRYHPHGDAAIYDALVKLAQDFSKPVTLVDPHGNFGTLDDPPAASRYTECRLSGAAMEMLDEIDESTVDLRATYDGEGTEPACLPARMPNLLVNGSSGIAVGMATNMAPHNLREVAEAIHLVLAKRRRKPTVDDLMALVPGPDFPSGGRVIDTDGGLRSAYESGRGSFRIRAKMAPIRLTRSRMGIEVTELPYNVGPEKVVKRINELVGDEKLPGVHDARNLSDRTGLKILIECQPNVPPESVYAELYRQTPLEEVFAINNVVLVDGAPTTVGLYDMCQHYIGHRLDVIVRRSEHRLGKARDRLHIVEGLLIALDNIDEVVSIIRKSKDAATASERLMKRLKLTEVQATHILDMQLRRLTALEKEKLVKEKQSLEVEIDKLEKLLASEDRRKTVLKRELDSVVSKYGRDRRTEIATSEDDLTVAAPAAAPLSASVQGGEQQTVALSTTGVVGRTPSGGRKRSQFGRHDVLVSSFEAASDAVVAAITSAGKFIPVSMGAIPEASGRSRGAKASDVFGTTKAEKIVAVTSSSDVPLALVTEMGTVKRVDLAAAVKSGKPRDMIGLKPGDSVIAAFHASDGDDIAIVSNAGKVLRFSASSVRVQGYPAAGVAGMKLGDAKAMAADRVSGGEAVIGVTGSGKAGMKDLSAVAAKGRGSMGVKVGPKEPLVAVVIAPPAEILAEVEQDGKPGSPVKLSSAGNVPEGAKIVGVGAPRW